MFNSLYSLILTHFVLLPNGDAFSFGLSALSELPYYVQLHFSPVAIVMSPFIVLI